MRIDHQLDVQGLACPMPIVKTKKTMNTMEVGETVEVIATDAGSKADLQAWAASTGHQYIGLVEEGSVLKHYLRKCNEAEEREKTFEQTASLEEVQNISNDSIVLDVREEVEYAFGHGPEYVTAQHRGRAAAAGASGMDVLGAAVEYQHPAVHIHHAELRSVLPEKALEEIMAQHAQVAGEYGVVIIRIAAGVGKMRFKRGICRRSHGRAHIC